MQNVTFNLVPTAMSYPHSFDALLLQVHMTINTSNYSFVVTK